MIGCWQKNCSGFQLTGIGISSTLQKTSRPPCLQEIDEDTAVRTHVEEEVADILLYLIRFASLANIDLQQAALKKIAKNAMKYPVARSKGSDKKYNE